MDPKSYLSLFQMPRPVKITGRSSSITNAFINSIIPVVAPKAEDIKQALDILGMTPETFYCAYCGGIASEWDHLRPLVKSKKPTGYISEIHNLVPSCGKCNQSKGNKDWRAWMLSKAKLSPTSRSIVDINMRIEKLEAYEKWMTTKVEFDSIVAPEIMAQHWKNHDELQSLMRKAQELATVIYRSVAEARKK
jgi:hypothetical protein